MTRPEESTVEVQPSQPRPLWRKVLKFTLIFATLSYVLDGGSTFDSIKEIFEDLRHPNGNIAREKESQHIYHSWRGDEFEVMINSVEKSVPLNDSFRNMVLGDTEEKSSSHLIDMRACVEKNCTPTLIIKMRVRKVEYVQKFPMVRFLPPRRPRRTRNLLSLEGESSVNDSADDSSSTAWKAYFQPKLTLSPVTDFIAPSPQIRYLYHVDRKTEKVIPLLYVNNFWVLRDHLIELNETTVVSPLNFTITISPIRMWRLSYLVDFDQAFISNMEMGIMRIEDVEELKRIFLETNPYFLALTFTVSFLHMFFEYLAMSNDVQFWRRRKNFTGLSLRTIVMNCYSKTIIFLYLWDNDETSLTVLIPTGIAVLIEFWKLTRTASVVRSSGGRWSLRFDDGYDKRTRKHDDVAVRYLMYLMVPILVGYTLYSALFNTHSGWYSFLISTQVRFIYLFGFAMMTPQIFINYKMKSVAQLPWRTFVYRALNTVVDDLFAFVVKMPWLHRLACFRDDIVFVILLYQRWIYPVDIQREADSDEEDDADEKSENSTGNEANTDKQNVCKVENMAADAAAKSKELEGDPTETKKTQ
ncbi:putative Cleft lip and palate transmembrane protein 1 (CLPTM1) [Trypanosoma vivax]|uniref:Cleft lip and palate transmembrane protein 1-like protein n=1 Tax=Trypanosoma vivax (strain Y486) TaxID=1055687 RepID=G0U5P2_TRYVY|nr:hypothetical protein TRVL_04177 [Trypanosoma vivax]KAH8607878.1 putative Cleft lip and palate transmembrane protein 1 (CLPTM1) [Trypanosoma vivax]CCC51193.1 conserved hypothetical protein [Trypanosoma vivax Y486]